MEESLKKILVGNPNYIPLDNNIVDTCITIPFTSKAFENKIDYQKWCYDWAKEILRVLKPGGIMMCIAPELSYHRMTCGIEDAGFEIRDCIVWFHSAESEKALLKPDYTPISIAQKPLDKNYVNNALKWGVAGYWIDGGRIPANEELGRNNHVNPYSSYRTLNVSKTPAQNNVGMAAKGRWPANLIHDGSDEVLELFPYTKSGSINGTYNNTIMAQSNGNRNGKPIHLEFTGDEGSAARFFYCAKASRAERDAGLDGINPHPTIKPINLMRYLVRLTKTPTGGIVLDPFMRNDIIMRACELEERDFIGIKENSEDEIELN